MNRRTGFTLIELIVVVAIIGVLAGLLLPVLDTLRKSGNKTREVHAGRQLAVAFASAATDQDGTLMQGYAEAGQALDDLGRQVESPVCNRYPWRLAKYLDYKVVGTLLVNDQAKISELRSNQTTYNYLVSLAPTFGLNSIMVGGDYHSVLAPTAFTYKRFGKFCATRMSEIANPSRMILFASAHYIAGDTSYYGYHTVEPPNLTGRNWQGGYAEKKPQSMGYIHLRYEKKAVVAMVDGHVELLGEEELRDMRRWSIQAAEADEPDFTLGSR
jgi:prepilin-type N-terminal cleavage/methylation domain-containing protein/prepilin-type processing-associated H-X9-DG protein